MHDSTVAPLYDSVNSHDIRLPSARVPRLVLIPFRRVSSNICRHEVSLRFRKPRNRFWFLSFVYSFMNVINQLPACILSQHYAALEEAS